MTLRLEDKLKLLVDQYFNSSSDHNDCFLLDIKVSANQTKIEVFIDSDTKLSYDKCQPLSRHLEAFLDESNEVSSKYVIEVGSPGLSRPLSNIRQYHKNIGKDLKIQFEDNTTYIGKLQEVSDNWIILEKLTKKKYKKKKVSTLVQTRISFSKIKYSWVEVRFK